MKIKTGLIVLTVLFSASFAFAEYGLGGDAGFNSSLFIEKEGEPALGISFRSDESPWCVTAFAEPFDSTAGIFLDNWFVYEKAGSLLEFFTFWGAGLSGNYFGNSLYFGPRLGIGFDMFLSENRNLEFYLQGAWHPRFGYKKNNDFDFSFKPFSIPVNGGLRIWVR